MPVKDDIATFTTKHRYFLALAIAVIVCEAVALIVFRGPILDWLSHNLWVVLIPFTKAIFKALVSLKLVAIVKAAGALLVNLSKLFILKFLKTLSIRYGVFFTQNRWYWIRRTKVMFLRRGKQFFRARYRFWSVYSGRSKWLIVIAYFPLLALLFLLGLSFNVTRRTMVQKTQETAVFQMATSASVANRGLKAWILRLDRKTLDNIRDLTSRARDRTRLAKGQSVDKE